MTSSKTVGTISEPIKDQLHYDFITWSNKEANQTLYTAKND